MKNFVKQKLLNGESTVGCFIGFYSPNIVEMLGYAGFDFVVIDNEHGAFSDTEIENMIRTAELVNLIPIVRVSYDTSSIQKALDRGAMGIQVPMVNTKEDAENVIQRAKYPPIGQRGTAFSMRAAKYGMDKGKSFMDTADNEILVAVHIETTEAVENFKEIMSVPGIDVAFIGSTDLSVSMGYKEEGSGHPEVQKAVNDCLLTAREMGIPVGIPVGSAKGVNDGIKKGATYIGVVGTAIINSVFAEVVKSGK